MRRSNRPVGCRAPPPPPLMLLLAAATICVGGRFGASALSCMCSMSQCEPPTDCGAGVARDACSCCYECARTANETCGGLFRMLGTCANGLYCETAPGDRVVDDGSVAAASAPAEVHPGICVPCKGPTRYGCDAIDGRDCQCGESCTKEFPYNSPEACRTAVHSRRGGHMPAGGQDGSVPEAATANHDSMPDYPPDEPSCLEVTCPDDRDLFVECPSDSWRRPLPEPALFEVCCGIHGMTDECVCKEPHSCPAPPMCDEGLQPIEAIAADGKPGACCSLYLCANVTSLQCEFKGLWYEHGEEVMPASLAVSASEATACQSCFCLDGQVQCRPKVDCPAVPSTCSWMAVAEGECCPTCRGCVSRSTLTFHAVGEYWQEDDCTSCECDVDGAPRCFASACAAPRCARPLKVPGRCCPVCSTASDDASSAAVDDGGRIDVVTYSGAENVTNSTTVVPAETLDVASAAGSSIVPPVETTPACAPVSCAEACGGEGRGERQPQGSDGGCSTCRCSSTSEPQLTTSSTSPEPDKTARTSTATLGGTTTGAATATPPTGGSGSGRCFTSLGHPRLHGETWFDGCRECICDNGRELCSLVACPPPACRHPVIVAGQCCPVCAENGDQQMTKATNITSGCRSASGHRRRMGALGGDATSVGDSLEESREAWRLDACSVCICHRGHALCETERCPPILCEQPVYATGRCCPTCPDSAYWPVSIAALPSYRQGCAALGGGRTYRHGDVWRASDCQSCTCQHGQLHCYSQTCPAAISTGIAAVTGGSTCTSAVSRKGQCCPICSTADPADIHHRVCIVNDQVLLHGQEWATGCLLCICYHGSRHCAPRPCSQLRAQMVGCGSSPSASAASAANSALTTDVVCCQHCLHTARDNFRERAVPATPEGRSVEMAVVATLAALLCLFAGVIVALVIIVVRRTRRRSGSATLSSVVPELQSLTGGGGAGGGGPASTAEMLPINNRPAIDSAAAAALRTGSAAGAGMRRPKSTNLEFYVGSFRYNNAALKDKEYCKPLVDAAGDGRTRNEYTLC